MYKDVGFIGIALYWQSSLLWITKRLKLIPGQNYYSDVNKPASNQLVNRAAELALWVGSEAAVSPSQ